MMNSLVFAGSLVAIAMVIYWYIKNDGVDRIGDQTGLFRMKDPEAEDTESDAQMLRHSLRKPKKEA